MKLARLFSEEYEKHASLEDTPFFNGILEVLVDLKKQYKQLTYAALSNSCTEYARKVISENAGADWDSLFSVVLGANDVPRGKPHGDGIIQIATQCGISLRKTIYVGDSPSDGDAASEAGVKGLSFIL